MFENILFILLIAFIIMGVFMIMRGRMNRSLKYSLKMERKRVPKLSDEDLQKRIKQAEKVHNNTHSSYNKISLKWLIFFYYICHLRLT